MTRGAEIRHVSALPEPRWRNQLPGTGEKVLGNGGEPRARQRLHLSSPVVGKASASGRRPATRHAPAFAVPAVTPPGSAARQIARSFPSPEAGAGGTLGRSPAQAAGAAEGQSGRRGDPGTLRASRRHRPGSGRFLVTGQVRLKARLEPAPAAERAATCAGSHAPGAGRAAGRDRRTLFPGRQDRGRTY